MTQELTPVYAPLEQYGKQARFGPCTDVYALGATLYHCLTGSAPPSSLDCAVGVEAPPPALINPHLGLAASNAVMWALQPQAPARPQTVEAFLDAFDGKNTAPQNQAPRASTPTTVLPPSRTPPSPHQPSATVNVSNADDSARTSQSTGPMWGNGVSTVDLFSEPIFWAALLLLLMTFGTMRYVNQSAIEGDEPATTAAVTTKDLQSDTAAVPAPTVRSYQPPVTTPTPATVMESSDAYATACGFIRDRLKRPSTALFSEQFSSNCTVWAMSHNQWKIESAGSA